MLTLSDLTSFIERETADMTDEELRAMADEVIQKDITVRIPGHFRDSSYLAKILNRIAGTKDRCQGTSWKGDLWWSYPENGKNHYASSQTTTPAEMYTHLRFFNNIFLGTLVRIEAIVLANYKTGHWARLLFE